MHSDEIKDVVQLLQETNRETSFLNNKPGDKWLKLFLQGKPAISKRNAEIISKTCASVTEQDIRTRFSDLHHYTEEKNALGIFKDGNRIYNADETEFHALKQVNSLVQNITKTRTL